MTPGQPRSPVPLSCIYVLLVFFSVCEREEDEQSVVRVIYCCLLNELRKKLTSFQLTTYLS